MTSTVAIVWPTPLNVEAYAAAGRDVEVPRPDCPACERPMIFWPGYRRDVRVGDVRRIWVRRAKCRACAATHALLPAFCLLRRLDAVEVIGSGLVAGVNGTGMRSVALALDVPHTTVRGWWRRFRLRAPMVAAAFAALATSLGSVAPALSAEPARAAVEATGAAWAAARRLLGDRLPPPWRFASAVSGGELLGTTTHPPWSGGGGGRLMPPVP